MVIRDGYPRHHFRPLSYEFCLFACIQGEDETYNVQLGETQGFTVWRGRTTDGIGMWIVMAKCKLHSRRRRTARRHVPWILRRPTTRDKVALLSVTPAVLRILRWPTTRDEVALLAITRVVLRIIRRILGRIAASVVAVSILGVVSLVWLRLVDVDEVLTEHATAADIRENGDGEDDGHYNGDADADACSCRE